MSRLEQSAQGATESRLRSISAGAFCHSAQGATASGLRSINAGAFCHSAQGATESTLSSIGAAAFYHSAGGATEYSPERSKAKLRDILFSASNPCQGVTEFSSLSLASQPKSNPVAPFQGLFPVSSTTPEFRCALLRALIRRAR